MSKNNGGTVIVEEGYSHPGMVVVEEHHPGHQVVVVEHHDGPPAYPPSYPPGENYGPPVDHY